MTFNDGTELGAELGDSAGESVGPLLGALLFMGDGALDKLSLGFKERPITGL